MNDLSPDAQVVLDAYQQGGLPAALRAAVDQVISDVTPPIDDCDQYSVGSAATHRKYRRQLLAIAAELEGKSNENPN